MKELYDKLVAAGDYVGDFNQFKKDYGGDEYENLYIKIADNGDYVGSFDDFKNDYEPVKITPTETDTAVEEVGNVSDALVFSDTESADIKSEDKEYNRFDFISDITPDGDSKITSVVEKLPYVGVAAQSYRAFMEGLEAIGEGEESADLMQAFEEGNLNKSDYQQYIKAKNRTKDNKPIQSIVDYEETYNKRIKDGDSGTVATLIALVSNPEAGFPMAMGSLAAVAGSPLLSSAVAKEAATYGVAGAATGAAVSAGATALATSFTGPGAVLAGGVAGVTGGVSGGINGLMFGAMKQLETQLFFGEEMNAGIEGELTEEKMATFFNNKDNVENIIKNAKRRGITVGAIETMFKMLPVKVGGLALKTLQKSGANKVVSIGAGGVAAATTEAGVGMVGEASGMAASGKELDAKQIIEEGILGPYGKVTSVVGYVKKVRTMQDELQASNLLKKADLNINSAEAFSPNTEIGEAQIGISKLKNGKEIVNYQVDRMVNRNDISEQEGKDIKQRFLEVQGGSNRLKSLKLDNVAEAIAINDLIKVDKLKRDIKQIDNKALSAKKQKELDSLNKQLEAVDSDLLNVIKKDSQVKVEKDVSFVKKAAKALKFKVVDDLSAAQILEKFGKKEAKANGFF